MRGGGRRAAALVLAALCLWACSSCAAKAPPFEQYGVYRQGALIAGIPDSNQEDRFLFVFRPDFAYQFLTRTWEDQRHIPAVSGETDYVETPLSEAEFSQLGFAPGEIWTDLDLGEAGAVKYSVLNDCFRLYVVDGRLWVWYMFGQTPVICQLEEVPDSVLEETTGLGAADLAAREAAYRETGSWGD